MIKRCKHCNTRWGYRPRGLCKVCYYNLSIRKLYKPKTTNRSPLTDFNSKGRRCKPTNAVPGSEEKIQVLCKRAEKGQQLFHPKDNMLLTANYNKHRDKNLNIGYN